MNKELLIKILEIARLALSNKQMFKRIGEEMDLSDEALEEILVKINSNLAAN